MSPKPVLTGPVIDPLPSLEERLRIVRERCRLLADLFTIQAEAAFFACHVSMTVDTFNVLTELCQMSADDLERLAHDMPGAVANWQPGAGITSERGGIPVDESR